jgi:type I site-specific restriction endonuclease
LVNQAYRLTKSGVAKRILFLVDRRAGANAGSAAILAAT